MNKDNIDVVAALLAQRRAEHLGFVEPASIVQNYFDVRAELVRVHEKNQTADTDAHMGGIIAANM